MNVEEKALKLIEDSINKKCNGLECKVVKNNIDLRLEIIRLNRQIDLMARAIDNYDSQLEINTFRNKEHVKQYFKEIAERKSENETK